MLKVLLVAVALLAVSPAFAQTAADTDKSIDTVLGGPHTVYATAIADIQRALKSHDVQGIAGYLNFGDTIKVNGKDETIADLDDLTAKFDTLFNAKVVSAVTGSKYESLLVNDQGIMFGNGELWITGTCDDNPCQLPFINIVAINNQ
jgi:hypothetical protein